MPKSACTVGSATMNDHMPTPPMVLISPVQARRRHAWGESVSAAPARPVIASMVFPGLCNIV